MNRHYFGACRRFIDERADQFRFGDPHAVHGCYACILATLGFSLRKLTSMRS